MSKKVKIIELSAGHYYPVFTVPRHDDFFVVGHVEQNINVIIVCQNALGRLFY